VASGKATAPVTVQALASLSRRPKAGVLPPTSRRRWRHLSADGLHDAHVHGPDALRPNPCSKASWSEKNGRSAEVLLGSVSSFDLMLANFWQRGRSLSVVAIYAAGAYAMAVYKGWTNLIPMHILPWFIIFQILGVLLFGSIFMAVGRRGDDA